VTSLGAWPCRASSQSCPLAEPAVPHPCSEEKAITSMPDNSTDVAIIVGVDTHKDIHVAVDIDTLGRRQGQLAVSATAAGYQQLHRWALDLGPNQGFGVEGTGSYGAGLARYLHNRGAHVIEVNRPRQGPFDPPLSGRASTTKSPHALASRPDFRAMFEPRAVGVAVGPGQCLGSRRTPPCAPNLSRRRIPLREEPISSETQLLEGHPAASKSSLSISRS